MLLITTDGVHFGHTLRGAKQRLDGVVVKQAKLPQLLRVVGGRSGCAGSVAQRVVNDFAQTGADRRKRRGHVARQPVASAVQSLRHELPQPIDVHAVLERHRDLRKPELGERPQFHHVGQARHFYLHRHRYQRFDFLGSQCRHLRVYLNLRVGNVGHGIDRQT